MNRAHEVKRAWDNVERAVRDLRKRGLSPIPTLRFSVVGRSLLAHVVAGPQGTEQTRWGAITTRDRAFMRGKGDYREHTVFRQFRRTRLICMHVSRAHPTSPFDGLLWTPTQRLILAEVTTAGAASYEPRLERFARANSVPYVIIYPGRANDVKDPNAHAWRFVTEEGEADGYTIAAFADEALRWDDTMVRGCAYEPRRSARRGKDGRVLPRLGNWRQRGADGKFRTPDKGGAK